MRKFRLKKPIIFSTLVLVLVVFIGFVEKRSSERTFQGISVYVGGVADIYFVDENEILAGLQAEFPLLQPGISLSEINLDKIERKVAKHPFVKNAEVYGDLKGNIRIEIEQHVPIARIVRPKAADGYISTEGLILPTSPNYTTRVMLLHGKYSESLLDVNDLTEAHQDLMDLITYIHLDEFWRAQITELEIEAENDIRMHQQVGRQVIEFGDAHDREEKFKRITLFYEEILPAKGWNTYERVSVKYKNQIICE